VITSLERTARAVWYSHFRPPMAQRRQAGFASSHFTRRALQVVHPVRTLDALSRVLLGAAVMTDAATKGKHRCQESTSMKKRKIYGVGRA
jgi:hypothetical protein